ncbi:MAG: ClpXP protease specificity-enhancing factor [Legionellaceae bacterium]|nr:ClpXP protease specificity-enhancing factor [Legionellaceae bacterium]HCA89579.1 ClpXP protease specificity-enhancing factor [Legionellales bacterium]|tara:strand:+ start:7576 stop:7977 length:402 start_codon:yes stop_codon:yes gene_type:complete
MTMTSNKPYLIKAMYDWITDNNLTPYILVNAYHKNVQVPQEHVQHGKIVLNISPNACRGLHIDNDRIVFTARFSGLNTQVFVVPHAVLAIYAKENGRGMEFGEEYTDFTDTTSPSSEPKTKHKPALKLVKRDE